jgi:OOP family OmpA-OmpF porin
MKIQMVLPVLAAMLMAACSSFTVGYKQQEAQRLAPVADPFQQGLVDGYRDFGANQYSEFDYRNSDLFYRKAIAAGRGRSVPLEDPANWSLDDNDRQAVVAMRTGLPSQIEAMKQTDPKGAAAQQVKFDCWIEELSEHEYADAEACKPNPGAAPLPPPPTPVAECSDPTSRRANGTLCAEGVVYFAFDRYDLLNPGENNDRAQTVAAQTAALDLIVNQVKTLRPARIDVLGRADAAGPEDYNYGLSECRAYAVIAELKKRGLPNVAIRTVPIGKTALIVPTADGIRDPANRVVMVTYQTDANAPLAHEPAPKPKKDLFGCGTRHPLPQIR